MKESQIVYKESFRDELEETVKKHKKCYKKELQITEAHNLTI